MTIISKKRKEGKSPVMDKGRQISSTRTSEFTVSTDCHIVKSPDFVHQPGPCLLPLDPVV